MTYEKKETLLKVSNVSIKLGNKQILRDINFEIKDIVRPDCVQGQVVALIGASGCGKSTTGNILAGLLKPDTGEIYLRNTIQGLSPTKAGDMGIVYQNYYLYEWRKVETILQFAANKNPAYKNLKENEISDAIKATSIDFNIADHLHKYPAQLSGGQKQRVAIAEQLLGGSEFILLDEPFSGLDPIMIDKMLQILIKVSTSDELKTLIIISHDLSNTIAISDTVYILGKEANKEGSTIVKEINLIDRDLAWHPDVKDMPEFRNTIKEIKSLI